MQGQTRSYVITTLVTAPATSNLTTLANVKDELDLESTETDNDARLNRYIAEISAGIAKHCNRVFGLATWQDEFRPQRGVWGEGTRAGVNPLKLTKWPLAAPAVAFTANTHNLSVLVDGIASTTALLPGMPVFGAGIASGALIETVEPFSIVLSAPATASATAISLNAGLNVIETIAGTSTQLVAGVDFEIDQASLLPGDEGAACLYRLNEQGNPRTWPDAQIVVVYQAGYILPADSGTTPETGAAMPADLEGICIRIIVGRFLEKKRDPMMRSRDQPSLGREEWWVGAMPGQTGPYPNDIMAVLDRYRVPVVG